MIVQKKNVFEVKNFSFWGIDDDNEVNYFRANNIKCVNKKLKEKGAKVALIDIPSVPKMLLH